MTDLNSPTALDDLAGERDDDDNDPAGDDRGSDPTNPHPYYAGTVATGPAHYPGHVLVSRYPAGVLLIDRPTNRAWVLDYDPRTGGPGTFTCRDIAGVAVDPAGRWRAAEGPDYDVRAYDPAFTGDDEPAPAPAGDPGGNGGEPA